MGNWETGESIVRSRTSFILGCGLLLLAGVVAATIVIGLHKKWEADATQAADKIESKANQMGKSGTEDDHDWIGGASLLLVILVVCGVNLALYGRSPPEKDEPVQSWYPPHERR